MEDLSLRIIELLKALDILINPIKIRYQKVNKIIDDLIIANYILSSNTSTNKNFFFNIHIESNNYGFSTDSNAFSQEKIIEVENKDYNVKIEYPSKWEY